MQPQAQPAPTLEQLEAQLTNLTLQRANLKDQLEAIEKVIPVLNGQAQLLRAQRAEAEAKAQAEADTDE